MQVPFTKRLSIPFSFVDSSGNAAKVDGTPDVSSTAGTVTVTQTPDGFTATIDPAGFVGSFTVSGTADADLGEGVKALAFSLGDHEALASPEAAAVKVGDAVIEG